MLYEMQFKREQDAVEEEQQTFNQSVIYKCLNFGKKGHVTEITNFIFTLLLFILFYYNTTVKYSTYYFIFLVWWVEKTQLKSYDSAPHSCGFITGDR